MKVFQKFLFMNLFILCFMFFSAGVMAEDYPDISSMFNGTKTETGENVAVKIYETAPHHIYYLELPFGSTAQKVILPVDATRLSSAGITSRVGEENPTFHNLFRQIVNNQGTEEYDYNYYNATAKTLTIPIAEMFWPGQDSYPYLGYSVYPDGFASSTWGYSYKVYCRYASPAKTFKINRESGYAAGDQWLNVAAAYDTESPLITNDTPVKIYIVNKADGKEADAVSAITETTVGAISPTVILEEKKVGIMAKDLAAGDYYVVLQTIAGDTADKVAYQYTPYKVYATANEYVKASLDDAIKFYQTPPNIAAVDVNSLPALHKNFWNANITKYPTLGGKVIDSNGYFYKITALKGPGITFNYYEYVGLSADSGESTGLDWETWIFPALGSKYPYVADDGTNKKLNFSVDGPILSNGKTGADQKTYLTNMYEMCQKRGWKTAQDLKISSKDSFRYIAALCAVGVDPRNPFPGQEYNPNFVDGLIYDIYEGASWNDDGSLNLDGATIRLASDGSLDFATTDVLFRSYFLLALEIANASPEEGYTDALRYAGVKGVLPTGQNFVNGILPEGDEAAGLFPIDVAVMSMLPLCFMTDDPVYGADINAMLDKLPAALAKNLKSPEYGNNANTLAVALNTLVCAGYTAEDLESDVYQDTYQTLLNDFIAFQLDNGGFAYVRANMGADAMATYQAVGALVDMYNGESTLKTAHKNYLYLYPQYTDGGQRFTALLGSLPGNSHDLKWNQVPTVIVARDTYNTLFQSIDKSQQKRLPVIFADQLTVLADLEANTGAAVGAAMGRLPDKDQVKLTDRSHVEAVRAAYNSLTEAQKAIADGENNVNISRLWGAERGLDQWDAKEVSNLILSLPSADAITALDRADVEAARAAYEGLSGEQQLLVDGATLKVLRDAERALTMLDAKSVIKAIDALPNNADVRVTDKNKITSVRGSYDALSNDQKSLVTNYSKLLDVEEAFSNLAVKAVETEILALPDAGKVTKADENAIKSARTAYDALTATQKEAISATVLARLTAAEAALEKAGKVTIGDLVDMKDASAWYYGAVAKCVEEGLFKGDANQRFNPMSNMTRAEFAQVLYNYYKDDANVMKNGAAKTFGDVKAGAWYYDAVMACAKAGLVNGDDKGNFNPNQPILRQDVALIMMRLSIGSAAIEGLNVDALLKDLAKQNLVFSDFDETSSYAQKAMAGAAGVIFFGDNGKLSPQSNITRAEMAQVMYNFLFK